MKKLRIVYMGTPEFAVEPLEKILETEHEVVAVVTVPDKPAGRGRSIQESDVKIFAQEKGLNILQPEKLRDNNFISALEKLDADIFVVVAFRMLPEIVWTMPKLGTINLHASLLPQYRGAAPINWAIINGETETGLTTFFISHNIDEGDILYQTKVEILAEENLGDLYRKLKNKGSILLVETLNKLAEGKYETKGQKHYTNLKEAPKIFKETCKILWDKTTTEIHNLIRGLSPYPAAWCNITRGEQSLTFKIYKSEKEDAKHNKKCGSIISDCKTYMKVACANGYINVLELQIEGKRRMDVKSFLAGFRDLDTYILE